MWVLKTTGFKNWKIGLCAGIAMLALLASSLDAARAESQVDQAATDIFSETGLSDIEMMSVMSKILEGDPDEVAKNYGLSREQLDKIYELLLAADAAVDPDVTLTEAQWDKIEEIADDAQEEAKRVLGAEQEKARKMIPQGPPHQLYYFVSFSMSVDLIKAYILDAIWTGGRVVFYGATKGMDVGDFVQQRILPLINYEGAQAEITIDPNAFEKYEVEVVPTIVFSLQEDDDEVCDLLVEPKPDARPDEVQDFTCKPLSEALYWKISGNISTAFAFEKMKEADAPVDLVMYWLAKRGDAMGSVQRPYEGEMVEAPHPLMTTK